MREAAAAGSVRLSGTGFQTVRPTAALQHRRLESTTRGTEPNMVQTSDVYWPSVGGVG